MHIKFQAQYLCFCKTASDFQGKLISPIFLVECLNIIIQEGTTEDEMVGWNYQLNRHEFEQALGVSDG